MLRYGTSCFLQLLDEDIPPAVKNRMEVMKSERKERLKQAAAKKNDFLSELARGQQSISLDHSYTCALDWSKSCVLQDRGVLIQQQNLINKLYHNYVSQILIENYPVNTQYQSDMINRY